MDPFDQIQMTDDEQACELIDALWEKILYTGDPDIRKECALHMRSTAEDAIANAAEFGWDGI